MVNRPSVCVDGKIELFSAQVLSAGRRGEPRNCEHRPALIGFPPAGTAVPSSAPRTESLAGSPPPPLLPPRMELQILCAKITAGQSSLASSQFPVQCLGNPGQLMLGNFFSIKACHPHFRQTPPRILPSEPKIRTVSQSSALPPPQVRLTPKGLMNFPHHPSSFP